MISAYAEMSGGSEERRCGERKEGDAERESEEKGEEEGKGKGIAVQASESGAKREAIETRDKKNGSG
eukprot:759433-Hanusia_phi.AAC.1